MAVHVMTCMTFGLATIGTGVAHADIPKFHPDVSDGTSIPTDKDRYPRGIQKQPAVAAQCFACHGPTGISQNPDWPNIAGQSRQYLVIQLEDFKSGARQHPMMAPVVINLNPHDIQVLAEHFSAQTPAKPRAGSAQVPAPANAATCMACHDTAAMPANPKLTGQKATYLEEQLLAFRSGKRKNATMAPMAQGLSDQDIRALAEHFAATAPAAAAPATAAKK